MKTVRDMIPDSQIESWERGDNVCIVAGTGAGKSYFIKATLVEHSRKNNKKILFLVHRTLLKDQIQLEINEMGIGDVFSVATYQYVELLKDSDENITLEHFDYVVADEFHYFLADSTFNNSTNKSLREILKTNVTRIFMSATPSEMIQYFKEYEKVEVKEYVLPARYSFIRTLNFIDGINSIKKITYETIEREKKTIIFTTSGVRRMRSLVNEFPSSMVYASPSNSKLYTYVDENKIERMIEERRFEEQVLITTTAMDAGVSLFDRDIETIIIDIRDITSIIQCLGRKRQIDQEDKVDLYIVVPSDSTFKNDLFKMESKLEALNMLENTPSAFHHNYMRYENTRKMIGGLVTLQCEGKFFWYESNPLAKFKLKLNTDMIKRYEQFHKLNLGFIMDIESIFKMTGTIIEPTKKSYTERRNTESEKTYYEKKKTTKAEKEKERLDKSNKLLKESEDIKELRKKTITYLSKTKDKMLTDTERKILFNDLSTLSQTPITSLPKANQEMKRMGMSYELFWKTVRDGETRKNKPFVRRSQ